VGALRRWIGDAWERLDREAANGRARNPGPDPRALVALTVVALVLIGEEYFGDRPTFDALFDRYRDERYFALGSLAWWAGAKLIGFLVVPMAAVRLLGGRLRLHGLGLGATRRHVGAYAALVAAVLPLVVAASFGDSFAATYPFYRDAGRSWSELVGWELLYGASFVAVEFFFRGYALFALERAIGPYAIFVMVVPYCMVHFGKPLAEVCGALVAGVVLGALALRTRSIWGGVAVHVLVAWSMDLLALARAGRWPS
jgi:membrane protease YdiL (CAAX protease family)